MPATSTPIGQARPGRTSGSTIAARHGSGTGPPGSSPSCAGRSSSTTGSAAAIDGPVPVVERDALAGAGACERGPDAVPDLGEQLGGRLAERLGVLGADEPPVVVVVEPAELWPPRDGHRAPRLEHHGDRRA